MTTTSRDERNECAHHRDPWGDAERIHRLLIQNANSAIIHWDREGIIRFMNDFGLRLFGYEAEEIVGRPVGILVPERESTGADISTLVEDVLAHPERYVNNVNENIRRDGGRLWMTWTNRAIHDDQGRITGILAIGGDITDLKRAEAAVRASEERFRTIVEGAPDPIFIQTERKFAYLNPAACRLFGISSPEEMIGRSVLDHNHPDSRAMVLERIRRLNEDREAVHDIRELRMLRMDGQTVWVETKGEPIVHEGKSGALVFVRDITQRKEAERAIRENAENLRVTLLSIGDAVISTDLEGRVRRMNAVAERLTGWTIAEAQRRPLEEVFRIVNAHTGEPAPNPVTRVLETGEIVGLANHTKLLSKTGEEYQIADSGSPIRDESGRIIGVVLVFRDVTEQYRMQEEIDRERRVLQLFVEHAPAAIAMFDADMRYLAVSRRFLEDFRLADQNVIGRSHYDLFPEIPERWKEIHRRCLAGAVERCEEDPFPRLDGSVDWTRWEVHPWYERSGKIGGIAIFSENITERKRAQDARLESERRISFALETSQIGAWDLDLTNHTAYRSPRHDQIFGYPDLLPEWTYEMFLEHVHPEDRPHVDQRFQAAIRNRTDWTFDCRIHRADGELRWIWAAGRQVMDESGTAIRMAGVVHDITERKRDERRIEHVTQVLRAMRDINHLIVHEKNRDQLLRRACDILIETRGYRTAWIALGETSGQLRAAAECGIGRDFEAIRAEIEAGREFECCRRALAGGNESVIIADTRENCGDCPIAFRYPDSSAMAGVLRHENRVYGILVVSLPLGMADDPTERSLFQELVGDVGYALYNIEQEDRRRRAEERYRLMFENTNDGIVIADAETKRFQYVNPAIRRFLGYSETEMTGLSVADIHPPEDLPRIMAGFERQIHGLQPLVLDVPCVSKDGAIVYADVNATPLVMDGKKCLVGFFRDITARKEGEREREKLREQLNQAQKMESVGRLAGGVAHDYNNILSVILGYTEMALERMPPDDPLHGDLTEILGAAKRSIEITRQLLAFARKQTISPTVLDLNDVVAGTLKMLQRLIGEDIDLSWHPRANPWPVRMDPSQIAQILANLCVNARDAISGVGAIVIETDKARVDAAHCARHPGATPGDFVVLSISDNGCGMEPDILDKIFEPFFTTKDHGKGTGLGLATVYGIVKQNEGFIIVDSEPGRGTTFRLYLPRYVGEEEEYREEESEHRARSRGETVLLVEDEPAIRKLTQRMLEEAGYTVFSAGMPGEALELAAATQVIDMLITDVVMPEMNGRELSERIRPRHPGMKILFMSGYTANVIAHRGVLDDDVNFIQKPFSRQTLTAKVRALLDRTA